MKLSNSKESNAECLDYLNKADETSKITNVNICKMKILLLLRENKQADAVHLLHEYQDMLNAMYQQPHTQEDAQWIAGEHTCRETAGQDVYHVKDYKSENATLKLNRK